MTFDFKDEMNKLNLDLNDFDIFIEENKDDFSERTGDEVEKIYILQERTLASIKELGLDKDVLADSMNNLIFNMT